MNLLHLIESLCVSCGVSCVVCVSLSVPSLLRCVKGSHVRGSGRSAATLTAGFLRCQSNAGRRLEEETLMTSRNSHRGLTPPVFMHDLLAVQ
ncbi:hypothetical protein QQF64_025628 [Cirrhinus molitorella]|uniref:Secreted protein n=1 Tax=Cirrhinus molitorella TaxID=172907 RepID=A0ABR3NPI8_9TELE